MSFIATSFNFWQYNYHNNVVSTHKFIREII